MEAKNQGHFSLLDEAESCVIDGLYVHLPYKFMLEDLWALECGLPTPTPVFFLLWHCCWLGVEKNFKICISLLYPYASPNVRFHNPFLFLKLFGHFKTVPSSWKFFMSSLYSVLIQAAFLWGGLGAFHWLSFPNETSVFPPSLHQWLSHLCTPWYLQSKMLKELPGPPGTVRQAEGCSELWTGITNIQDNCHTCQKAYGC